MTNYTNHFPDKELTTLDTGIGSKVPDGSSLKTFEILDSRAGIEYNDRLAAFNEAIGN